MTTVLDLDKACIATREELTRRLAEGYPKLHDVSLAGYDLSGLDFRHARVERPNLEKCSMRDCNLEGCRFAHANMDDINLSWANLCDAVFSQSSLMGANLRDMAALRTDFTNCNMASATINGHWEFVRLDGCRVDYARLDNLFPGIIFRNCEIRRSFLIGLNGVASTFIGTTFDASVLTYASLPHARFYRCEFSNTNILNVKFQQSVFQGCEFTQANLEKTDFTGAYISHTSFTGANLRGADFTGATIHHSCDFTDAELDGAKFDDAILLEPLKSP